MTTANFVKLWNVRALGEGQSQGNTCSRAQLRRRVRKSSQRSAPTVPGTLDIAPCVQVFRVWLKAGGVLAGPALLVTLAAVVHGPLTDEVRASLARYGQRALDSEH